MTDAEFLEAFETCRIPKSDWTHQAHVRMAWLYLRLRPLDEVIPTVRRAIRRYNASLGNTEGYHESITLAYLRLIDARMDRGSGEATFEAFSRAHPALLDREMSVLLQHYSRELLFSKEAVRTFVEPDLMPLPGSRVVDFEGGVG